jgi:hypothetical protein
MYKSVDICTTVHYDLDTIMAKCDITVAFVVLYYEYDSRESAFLWQDLILSILN